MILHLRPKVLIVTQELIIAADLCLQMSKLNYDVLGINTTSNDAIDTIVISQPSVILIDIGLKGSIDGIQLGEIVRLRHNIPVVFLNPGVDPMTLNRAIRARPSGFMHIPYEAKNLKFKVEAALNHEQQCFLQRAK